VPYATNRDQNITDSMAPCQTAMPHNKGENEQADISFVGVHTLHPFGISGITLILDK
jgi:hypothetical protein